MWGRPLTWSTARIWALAAGGADEPGVIWCGTLPGGLFRSTDHGQSWEMMRALWEHPKRKQWMGGGADLPGHPFDLRRSARFQPRVDRGIDRRHLVHRGCRRELDATGRGYARRICSARAGARPRSLRTCTASCNALPRRSACGCSITTASSPPPTRPDLHRDHRVEPSTFGFAVAVHPRDPDTAWFVPEIKDEKRIPREGKLVVTRTRDGGKSFDVLSKGLPQSHAYDVVYRHGLALDDTGERLAFGSTTGGLWVSEDQGDSWACVTHTLPPIYAVRFG